MTKDEKNALRLYFKALSDYHGKVAEVRLHGRSAGRSEAASAAEAEYERVIREVNEVFEK